MLDRTKETLHRIYHEEGKTLVELGALYERSPGTVWGWFKRHGIPTRSHKEAAAHKESAVTEDEKLRIKELYLNGQSSNDIGEELGRCGRLIRTHLEGMGVIRNRTEAVRLAVDNGKIRSDDVQVNDHFFDTLTPESAWVLGLIYGDGHVRNNAEHYQYMVYLAGSEEVCRKVAKLIGHERGPAPHNQGANCWVLKWSSRRMVKFLEETYGVSGNKSKRLRLPNLPEELMGHFLRGLWDADGHWAQPKPTHSLFTVLTTASIGMVEDLSELLSSKGIETKSWSGTTTLNDKDYATNTVRLRSYPTKKFAKWLYEGSYAEMECSRKSLIVSRSYTP
jgi:DNA-binding CsgD family transcriptional regulator